MYGSRYLFCLVDVLGLVITTYMVRYDVIFMKQEWMLNPMLLSISIIGRSLTANEYAELILIWKICVQLVVESCNIVSSYIREKSSSVQIVTGGLLVFRTLLYTKFDHNNQCMLHSFVEKMCTVYLDLAIDYCEWMNLENFRDDLKVSIPATLYVTQGKWLLYLSLCLHIHCK